MFAASTYKFFGSPLSCNKHLVARQKIRAASAGDFIFVMFGLLEFGSLESPPSNSLRATRKPDVLVLSEICG
jgi:hypothetical protein